LAILSAQHFKTFDLSRGFQLQGDKMDTLSESHFELKLHTIGVFLSVVGVRALQFFCKTMSIAQLIDHRKMIFGKKLV